MDLKNIFNSKVAIIIIIALVISIFLIMKSNLPCKMLEINCCDTIEDTDYNDYTAIKKRIESEIASMKKWDEVDYITIKTNVEDLIEKEHISNETGKILINKLQLQYIDLLEDSVINFLKFGKKAQINNLNSLEKALEDEGLNAGGYKDKISKIKQNITNYNDALDLIEDIGKYIKNIYKKKSTKEYKNKLNAFESKIYIENNEELNKLIKVCETKLNIHEKFDNEFNKDEAEVKNKILGDANYCNKYRGYNYYKNRCIKLKKELDEISEE